MKRILFIQCFEYTQSKTEFLFKKSHSGIDHDDIKESEKNHSSRIKALRHSEGHLLNDIKAAFTPSHGFFVSARSRCSRSERGGDMKAVCLLLFMPLALCHGKLLNFCAA